MGFWEWVQETLYWGPLVWLVVIVLPFVVMGLVMLVVGIGGVVFKSLAGRNHSDESPRPH